MSVKLLNDEDQTEMSRRKWINIRIDEDVERRLSDRGKFKQSYNDVIAALLDEIEGRSPARSIAASADMAPAAPRAHKEHPKE